MNFVESFIKLTEYTVPFGYEETLEKYLPSGYKKDEVGNYYYTIGQSETLFTSHLDTASKERQKVNHVINGNCISTDGSTILGGDNKAGCLILFYLIEKNVPGTYYFFLGEESSVHGNFPYGSCLAIENNPNKFKKFKRCISFDRKEEGQLVTRQLGQNCCSDEFADSLILEFSKNGLIYHKDNTGYYTDGAFFSSIIPEIVNLSCGVYNEHHINEYVNLKYTKSVAVAAANINWEILPSYRTPNNHQIDTRVDNPNSFDSENPDAIIFKEIFKILDDIYFVCREIRNYNNFLKHFTSGRVYNFSDWHNDINYKISINDGEIKANDKIFKSIAEFKNFLVFSDMDLSDFIEYLILEFNKNSERLTSAEFFKLITLKGFSDIDLIKNEMKSRGYILDEIGKGYQLKKTIQEKYILKYSNFLKYNK